MIGPPGSGKSDHETVAYHFASHYDGGGDRNRQDPQHLQITQRLASICELDEPVNLLLTLRSARAETGPAMQLSTDVGFYLRAYTHDRDRNPKRTQIGGDVTSRTQSHAGDQSSKICAKPTDLATAFRAPEMGKREFYFPQDLRSFVELAGLEF